MQFRVDPKTQECCSTCAHFVHYLSNCNSDLPKNAPRGAGRPTEYDLSPCPAWEKGYYYDPDAYMGLGRFLPTAPEVG